MPDRPAPRGAAPAYEFKPHERPFMPGSPATPDHPPRRRLAYFLIGVVLGLSGGFANGLLVANIQQIQGAFGLTSVEAGWLTAAYSMTNVCTSMLLIKFRQRFGVGVFARIFLPAFAVVSLLQLFFISYPLELLLRGIAGIVASGLSSFCLFYVMQSLPAKARLAGMVIGIGLSQLALPLARAISPLLLATGEIRHLFAFELGLSLFGVACAALLPLPPSNKVDAFEPLDFLTFSLLAPGVALLSAVLALGRTVWWSTPWLGYALAGAAVLIAAAHIVEHNRANPLLNLRWMSSLDIIQFALLAATMRVLLSEQNFGASGLLMVVGMGNDQLVSFYAIMTAATLAGLIASVLTLNPQDLLRPIVISTFLIAIAAWMDSDASNLTRPVNLYLSQALIAFAAIYFVGAMMMNGILRALSRGPSHIISFTAVFSISQTLGGLAHRPAGGGAHRRALGRLRPGAGRPGAAARRRHPAARPAGHPRGQHPRLQRRVHGDRGAGRDRLRDRRRALAVLSRARHQSPGGRTRRPASNEKQEQWLTRTGNTWTRAATRRRRRRRQRPRRRGTTNA
jgi:MFS family permease